MTQPKYCPRCGTKLQVWKSRWDVEYANIHATVPIVQLSVWDCLRCHVLILDENSDE